MENEIMVNEEVVETVEETTKKLGNGWKIAAGVGLAALVGIVIYKVGKKVAANIKAKKSAELINNSEDDEVYENVEYSDET